MRQRTWSYLIAVTLVAATAPARAGEQVLTLRPETTEVSFDLEATGHDVHGVVQLARGEIRFDDESGGASGEIVLDAGTSATGNSSRDETMHQDVLEVARFPQIRFVPRRLVGRLPETGSGQISLEGTIVLHGTEHPLVLPATVTQDSGVVRVEATFPIPYQEWGMEDPSILFLRVAKVVSVTVKAEGSLSEVPVVAAGG